MAIPQSVLTHVALHVRLISNFNAEVERLRALGQRFGSPGRYEWEYRLKAEALAEQSEDRLDEIEGLAINNHEDPDALYAAPGRPSMLPWSTEALEWRRSA